MVVSFPREKEHFLFLNPVLHFQHQKGTYPFWVWLVGVGGEGEMNYVHQSELEQLCRVSSDIEVAVSLDHKGEVLAFAPSDGAVDETIAPLVMTLAEVSDRATQELGRGLLEIFVVGASRGFLVGCEIEQGGVIAALTSSTAPLGLLMADVGACAEAIKEKMHQ